MQLDARMKKLLILIIVIFCVYALQTRFFNKCAEYGCLAVNGEKLSFSEAEQAHL